MGMGPSMKVLEALTSVRSASGTDSSTGNGSNRFSCCYCSIMVLPRLILSICVIGSHSQLYRITYGTEDGGCLV